MNTEIRTLEALRNLLMETHRVGSCYSPAEMCARNLLDQRAKELNAPAIAWTPTVVESLVNKEISHG